jgi:uncharacterized membrane protein
MSAQAHIGKRDARVAGRRRWPAGWGLAFLGLTGLTVAGFALAPGDLGQKAHMALHGLCAQRPDRTFALGGAPLPFDARMTGIYLGALAAGAPLLLAGRRGVRLDWRWLALLAAGVVAMGMDGLNSLRVDLGLAAWWAPDNHLRLATGLLAGAGLGVALVWLVNLALWPADAPLLRPADAPLWLAAAAAAAGVVLSGAGWALWPATALLLAAAVLTLLGLNLALLGLTATGRAGPAAPATARLATLALAAALIEMAALAGGRFALESALGRGFL